MTFTFIESQDLPDIHSTGHLYQHEQTGAQILHLENEDDNKAFTIAFKTPPYDNNGITHILEHSVLNGSQNYPSKEPFVELIKSSLNTFLNAMTYPDKTVYPVASTNDKDYLNLMQVYLDAVFKPKLITDPQILAQEGWHYHLENIEDDLIYKGVVYNEMKGALSSPARAMNQAMCEQLYRGSIYAYESGGDPVAIPELTQEAFVDYHQKYYHPSNSLTVVYGDIDKEMVFGEIGKYFDAFDKLEEVTDLRFDLKIPDNKDYQDTYSITEGDDPNNKAYLGLGWHIGLSEDKLDMFGMHVLNTVLFSNNDAPLKKALLQANIGGDISADVDELGWPVAYMIEIQDADEHKLDIFKKVVKETLSQLVEEGIDQELITAAINIQKFALREAAISESIPRGVVYSVTAFSTWLYGSNPYKSLSFNDLLDELADKAKEGFFEQLIQDKILNNQHHVSVTLLAEPGKNDKIEAERLAKLQEYKASLSQEALEEMVSQTRALIARQEAPDRPEDLAKIPTLTREDLSPEIVEVPLEQIPLFEGTELHYSDQFTSEIDYLTYYFDISDFSQEEFSELRLLTHLLGNLDTKKHTLGDLKKLINTNTGDIFASCIVHQDFDGVVKPYLSVQGKALYENLDYLISLMTEIVKETVINDKQKVLQLVQTIKVETEMQINHRSHALASDYALAQMSIPHALRDRQEGIAFFYYIKDILAKLQNGGETALFDSLNKMQERLLNRSRIHALYIGDKARVEKIKEAIVASFADIETATDLTPAVYELNQKQNVAFVTAQDVNYVAVAKHADSMKNPTGSDAVLGTILRYEYLWNAIRVKGGAYGAMYSQDLQGNVSMVSYRDPNIMNTFDTYAHTGEFIEQLSLTPEEILKYVIGSISPLERPLSAYDKGVRAFNRYQIGMTDDLRRQHKVEILNTTEDEIKERLAFFHHWQENATQVVIGNKVQIESIKDKFDVVHELF